MNRIPKWAREKPTKVGWFWYRDHRGQYLTYVQDRYNTGNFFASRLDLVSKLTGEWLDVLPPGEENELEFDLTQGVEYLRGKQVGEAACLAAMAEFLEVKVLGWDGIEAAIKRMQKQIVDLQQLLLKSTEKRRKR